MERKENPFFKGMMEYVEKIKEAKTKEERDKLSHEVVDGLSDAIIAFMISFVSKEKAKEFSDGFRDLVDHKAETIFEIKETLLKAAALMTDVDKSKLN